MSRSPGWFLSLILPVVVLLLPTVPVEPPPLLRSYLRTSLGTAFVVWVAAASCRGRHLGGFGLLQKSFLSSYLSVRPRDKNRRLGPAHAELLGPARQFPPKAALTPEVEAMHGVYAFCGTDPLRHQRRKPCARAVTMHEIDWIASKVGPQLEGKFRRAPAVAEIEPECFEAEPGRFVGEERVPLADDRNGDPAFG